MSDEMMFGIAQMPYEMAMNDELSRRQFYANTQRLVAALEAAREDALVLRLGNERLADALRELEDREQRDEALLRQAAHPTAVHCDNCGCDWLDNGLNPIGCPYCKQSEAVDEAMVERIAALLYEEATDEPWIVAGIEHPGHDRDYYRGLASKVVALVDPTRFMQRVRRDEALFDRDEKLRRTIHAEENALLFAGRPVEGCTIA